MWSLFQTFNKWQDSTSRIKLETARINEREFAFAGIITALALTVVANIYSPKWIPLFIHVLIIGMVSFGVALLWANMLANRKQKYREKRELEIKSNREITTQKQLARMKNKEIHNVE